MGLLDRLDGRSLLELVTNCARCGRDHRMVFRPLRNPQDNFRHWGMCPNTGQPVLLAIALVGEGDAGLE